MDKRRVVIDSILVLIACVFTGFSLMTGAAPTGGVIVAGDITIGSDPSKGIDTQITQTSGKGIINWQSFSIGHGEHTNFTQPNASSVTLNRVTGGNISEILGQLTANGRILLINPSGVLFGPNSRIDVAGLIASTADITNAKFLSGNYTFNQGSNNLARIINQGKITARDNGMIALVAPGVENSGIIEANLGTVILGSAPAGSRYTIDFFGDGLLQFSLPPSAAQSLSNTIVQSGQIQANGGTVLLSANTAKGVVDSAINMSGIIEANSIGTRHGQIILMGGNGTIAEVSGKMQARGNRSGEKGGTVKILLGKVALTDGATIDVSGKAGGGEALIGGDYHGGGGLPTSETVYVDPHAAILANALESGNGGKIIVWSDNATGFYGTAEAKGGPLGGNGGFIETSSKNWLDVSGAKVNASALAGVSGTWLLDPYNVVIVDTPPSTGGGFSCVPYIFTTKCTWVPTGVSTVAVQDILSNLSGAYVVISTSGGGSDAGNITVNAPISYTDPSYASLTLTADNNIIVNAPISGNGINFQLLLYAVGNIDINAPLTNIGDLAMQGPSDTSATNISINAPINIGDGGIFMFADQNIVINAPVIANSILTASNTFLTTANAPITTIWKSHIVIEGNNGLVTINAPLSSVGDIEVYAADPNSNIVINAPIANAGGLILTATNDITFNAQIGSAIGTPITLAALLLDAGNNIFDLSNSVNVGIFELRGGIWNQTLSNLPGFFAQDFHYDPLNATFARAIGGNGTSGNPYQITDIYGLAGIGSSGMLSKSYVLMNDIDASTTSGWTNSYDNFSSMEGYLGTGFTPIGMGLGTNNLAGLPANPFTGTFDGQNHTISNLNINSADDYAALFGYTSGATIENLGLKNVNIFAAGPWGLYTTAFTGALVGKSSNGTVISKVSTAGGTLSGENFVGGLIGAADSSTQLTNAYSTTNVAGNSNVGGLIGSASGGAIISNTYSAGSVVGTGIGPTNVGGFLGSISGAAVNASFWDNQTSGQTLGVGDGTVLSGLSGLPTSVMKTKSTFLNVGWDFTNIWNMIEGITYPEFVWQLSSLPPSLPPIDPASVLPPPKIIDDKLDSSGPTVPADYVNPIVKILADQEESADFLLLTSPYFECQESIQQ